MRQVAITGCGKSSFSLLYPFLFARDLLVTQLLEPDYTEKVFSKPKGKYDRKNLNTNKGQARRKRQLARGTLKPYDK